MSAPLSRAARVLLLLSLALNVALGTWWAAHALRHDGGGRGARAALPQLVDLREFRRALPEPRRTVVDEAFAAHRPAMRERLVALHAARRDVREAMRAEAYDRGALDAAFERLREAESAAAREAQALLADVLDVATVEERRRLSELVPRRRERERGAHRAAATVPEAPPQ